jgi:aspartyl-tRNA(Asn)/glutamyl-tRNA(Gln) amidotransferase subunit A
MAAALASVDALLLPTASDVAPTTETTGDPSFQAPFSLVGFPSLSLPSGLIERADLPGRMPLAIQLVALPWQEARLLSVARWCEQQLPSLPAPPLASRASVSS